MPWTKQGTLKGPGSLIDLGTVTLTRTATVALASGIRTQNFIVTGLKTNDNVLLTPIEAVPAGFLVGLPIVRTSGSSIILDIPIYEAAMILNASYSFKARVIAVRS